MDEHDTVLLIERILSLILRLLYWQLSIAKKTRSLGLRVFRSNPVSPGLL